MHPTPNPTPLIYELEKYEITYCLMKIEPTAGKWKILDLFCFCYNYFGLCKNGGIWRFNGWFQVSHIASKTPPIADAIIAISTRNPINTSTPQPKQPPKTLLVLTGSLSGTDNFGFVAKPVNDDALCHGPCGACPNSSVGSTLSTYSVLWVYGPYTFPCRRTYHSCFMIYLEHTLI